MKFRFALTFLLLIIMATPCVTEATSSIPPPPNIRITTIPQLNNEQQVFISPVDSNVIIANWRDFRLGYRQIGIGRSSDAGLTWVDSLIPPGMQYFGASSWQSDPTMTVSREGIFYMSVLDFISGVDGQSTIAFYRSIDSGVSWSGPFVNVVPDSKGDLFEDKQFITVDRTGGLYDGNVYLSWTRFPNPDRIVFQRSLDSSTTWGDTILVGPTQTSTGCGASIIDAGQFSIPVVSVSGDVHVFWQGTVLDSGFSCSGHTAIKQRISFDGGQTFGLEDTVLRVSGWTSARGGIGTYSQPAADADISGGAFNGNIYIAFTNFGPEDPVASDVDIVRSTDNGITWSERYRINDEQDSEQIHNFHPWLVVNQEGVVIVVFYDERFDSPNYINFDLLTAYSFDGGETFTVNRRLTDVSSSPFSLKREDGTREAWVYDDDGMQSPQPLAGMAGLLGEYIGVTAFHDKINAVWTDSRHGNSECYTANWYLAPIEPRLMAPDSGLLVPSPAQFRWATSWKHDQDRYRLEISTDQTFSSGVVTRVIDTTIFPFDSTLSDGVYFWRVKTFNTSETDSSDYSKISSFEIDITPPSMPTLLLPPDSSETGDSTPFFDWADAVKAASPVTYDLELSTDPLFPATPATTIYAGLGTSEFTIPDGLTPDVVTYWRVRAIDAASNETLTSSFLVSFVNFICGDINDEGGIIDISDLTYVVAYMFGGGPPPPVLLAADVDASGEINIEDLTILVAFMFGGGPAPVCP